MKVYIHKLGCPKNDVDADYIAARLVAAGHEPVQSAEAAEAVVVNTCGFIQAAKEESIEALLAAGRLKQGGPVQRLYAAGCLSQRYGDVLLREMPELDGAFGHGALDSLAKAVTESARLRRAVRREPRKLAYLSWKDRFIADALPYAYVKISDGCDRPCTYCAIPAMRGRFRSRPVQSIVNEARFLAAHGKRELILVSQEATLYGYDLPGRPGIIDLLEALSEVEGVEWLRLMYLFPSQVDDRLIEYLLADNKTLPYFDLPLQHVNADILARMKRPQTTSEIEALLTAIRRGGSHATIRTTFIVGFPGETEEAFEELKDAVRRWQFDRMGVFTFSPEEGTPAERMPDQIPEEVRQQRLEELMSVQRDIAELRNRDLVGQTVEVLIDSVESDGTAIGRTAADCPEIDQEVRVDGGGVEAGRFYPVRITDSAGYDLFGRVAGEGR